MSVQCLDQIGVFSTGWNSVTHGVEVGVGVGVGVGGVVAGVVAGVVCGVVGDVVGGLDVGVGVGVREDGLGEADVGRTLELVRDGVRMNRRNSATCVADAGQGWGNVGGSTERTGGSGGLDEGRSPPRRKVPGSGADADPRNVVRASTSGWGLR